MCDPVTMTTIALASAAFTATQQVKQGNYRNKVVQYNARVTENEAQQVRNQGTEAENIKRQETAQLLARQRAQLGAANVDLTSGSALALQQETETLGNIDALRIRSNTEGSVSALQERANLQRLEGRNARSAGRNKAFGSLLGGVGQAAGAVKGSWFTPDSAAVVGGSSGLMSTAPLTTGIQ